jgi:hypothetical protein
MGLTVPAGQADTEPSGAGAKPAPPSATSAAATTGAATTGAATLATPRTLPLHKNCHLESSLATFIINYSSYSMDRQ